MNIVVSMDNNKEILVFPVVPREVPLKNPSKNEEFETDNGTLNLLGKRGLRTFNISSFFPKNKETWSKPGSEVGQKYIDFFNKSQDKNIPVRVVVSLADGTEWLNILSSVENFDYHYDKAENIRYSLDFKEYTQGSV